MQLAKDAGGGAWVCGAERKLLALPEEVHFPFDAHGSSSQRCRLRNVKRTLKTGQRGTRTKGDLYARIAREILQ